MKKTFLSIAFALFYLGTCLVVLGSLYKIQSWEIPAFLPLDLLSLGLITGAIGVIPLFLAFIFKKESAASERLELTELDESALPVKTKTKATNDLIL